MTHLKDYKPFPKWRLKKLGKKKERKKEFNKIMLSLLLIIPLIGSFIILPIQEDSENNRLKMKNIAIGFSILNFIFSIYLWVQFDSSYTNYQVCLNKLSMHYYEMCSQRI